MILLRNNRQYAGDLNIETRRPHAPRNLVFNEETLELTWTGPVTGPKFTHFNIRIGDDRAEPSFCFPKGTERLFLPNPTRVTITCWNETVRTESDAARITTGSIGVWDDSSTSSFGLFRGYEVFYDLGAIGASITVVSPVASKPLQRLIIRVLQDPAVLRGLDFDPAGFVDTASQAIDLSKEWVREWGGHVDGKWYPITTPLQYDPTI